METFHDLYCFNTQLIKNLFNIINTIHNLTNKSETNTPHKTQHYTHQREKKHQESPLIIECSFQMK